MPKLIGENTFRNLLRPNLNNSQNMIAASPINNTISRSEKIATQNSSSLVK